MARCLISGANGFIGGHLKAQLEQLGHKVAPINRTFLESLNDLKEFLRLSKPDYIFHLAAYGNHNHQTSAKETMKVNFMGTFNLLEASKNINYKKFINFSTSSVLLPTETFYSASKAGAERLANAFSYQLNKPVLTVRPFSIFGENEADFRFIPTIIKSLLTGESMPLALNSYHDWVYIRDFIDNLILLTFSKTVENGIINMGTGTSYSNLEIVRFLEEISGKKLNYITTNLRDFDTKNWVSPDKTIKSDIKKGLQNTYEYYKSRFEA